MDIELRPPLPPHLAHDDIEFVYVQTNRLSSEIVAAIGAALHALLPHGDISVRESGQLEFSASGARTEGTSLWHRVARLEAIERSIL
jgi:hypothetical protein